MPFVSILNQFNFHSLFAVSLHVVAYNFYILLKSVCVGEQFAMDTKKNRGSYHSNAESLSLMSYALLNYTLFRYFLLLFFRICLSTSQNTYAEGGSGLLSPCQFRTLLFVVSPEEH